MLELFELESAAWETDAEPPKEATAVDPLKDTEAAAFMDLFNALLVSPEVSSTSSEVKSLPPSWTRRL